MAKITGNMVKCDECGAVLADPDNQADYEKYDRIICEDCGNKIICFNCLELKAVARMKITYIPPGPYDALMERDLRKIEKSLPSTPRPIRERNLLRMVELEPQDPAYWGPRILAMSLKLGI